MIDLVKNKEINCIIDELKFIKIQFAELYWWQKFFRTKTYRELRNNLFSILENRKKNVIKFDESKYYEYLELMIDIYELL